MNTGLAGTGLVADDLYLMAHPEVTGKPFVQPRPLGIGLAAALVAELMPFRVDQYAPSRRRHLPDGGRSLWSIWREPTIGQLPAERM